MNLKELKNAALTLRELGLSYQETLDAMNAVAKDLGPVKHMWKRNDQSRLIKLGLALITFPEPTPISETLGAVVLSMGVVHKKMKQSVLHVDDVYGAFQEVVKGLHTIKKEETR